MTIEKAIYKMLLKGMRCILRVISGSARGCKIQTTNSNNTRPTTDRVKEAMFSIITNYIIDANVLDLFSGSGSLGIEALSRGADFATFVDHSKTCHDIIEKNLEKTRLIDKSKIYCCDIIKALNNFASNNCKFDIIFMDPPYFEGYLDNVIQFIADNNLLNEDGIIVVERHNTVDIKDNYAYLKLKKERSYGEIVLSFFEKE